MITVIELLSVLTLLTVLMKYKNINPLNIQFNSDSYTVIFLFKFQ